MPRTTTPPVEALAAVVGPGSLTTRELAEALRVSHRTIQEWRRSGGGPTFETLSASAVRYSRGEVARWLLESTSDRAER